MRRFGSPLPDSESLGTAAPLTPDESTLAPGIRLLPRESREDVYRLYDILRTLDDLVDDRQPEAEERVEAVERWAEGEDVDTYETRRLKQLEERHALPKGAFVDFCAGMRHDIERRVIHDEEDFERYAQQAGGSVGVMLACLLGGHGPEAEAKMSALGRAMQRTNILRDIDEDTVHGRVYIARSAIERFGEPLPGARAELLREQIARADELFDEAEDGLRLLARGRFGMTVCTILYREILRQLERDVVPVWRRRMLVARCRLGSLPVRAGT
jgi:phytoene synthase